MRSAARHLGFQLAALVAFAAVSLAQSPLIELGRTAIARGDDDAAIEIFQKAVAQSPKDAQAHFCLASAYGSKAQKGGMLGAVSFGPKAKAEFEATVALDPKHVEARYALVQFYAGAPEMMGGSYDDAFAQAKAIKALDPVVGHRAYAFVYTQQKKAEQAKQEYLTAIREQPGSPKAHSYFGLYLANTEKNFAAASAEFETALKVDATYMPALYQLGRTAALADSNLARGEAALKQYLDYTPKENEPTLARAQLFLGNVYEKEKKTAEAKQSYQKALELNPSLKEATEALKRLP
jgi:tetratricopeptide (TPR) repeat protein